MASRTVLRDALVLGLQFEFSREWPAVVAEVARLDLLSQVLGDLLPHRIRHPASFLTSQQTQLYD